MNTSLTGLCSQIVASTFFYEIALRHHLSIQEVERQQQWFHVTCFQNSGLVCGQERQQQWFHVTCFQNSGLVCGQHPGLKGGDLNIWSSRGSPEETQFQLCPRGEKNERPADSLTGPH